MEFAIKKVKEWYIVFIAVRLAISPLLDKQDDINEDK